MPAKVKSIAKKYLKNTHAHKIGYAIAVVVNVIMLWAVAEIPSWQIKFITSSFSDIQFIFSLSFLIAIIGQLLLILHDPKWFHGFVRLVSNSITFLALISLYFVFPFDFSMYSFSWPGLVKILIILATLGTAIGVITEFLQLIFRKDYRNAEE